LMSDEGALVVPWGGSEAMDKRYQVFISSTFEDLKAERQAILRAVLELDQMPAGMELFPAADEDAWQLIRDVIDASDYYVVVIGGRYGSVDEDGVSYTEREYEYAVSRGKPVIPLLHSNPDEIARGKTETSAEAWEKLLAFRKKVETNHTCSYWAEAGELKSKLIVGLTTAMKRRPGVGWIRADEVPSDDVMKELYSLRNQIAQLKEKDELARTEPPPGAEELVQGGEQFEISFSFTAHPSNQPNWRDDDDVVYEASINPTWDELFSAVAPRMIDEASDSDVRSALRRFLADFARKAFADDKELEGYDMLSFSFSQSEIDTCLIQLRALGLIRESKRKRSVKDTETYWTLTPYGDYRMVQLRAIRRREREVPAERERASRGTADKKR